MNERIKKMNPSGSRFNQLALRAGVGFVLLLIVAAVGLAIGFGGRTTRAYPAANAPSGGSLTSANSAVALNSYSPIVSRVAPAVVTIRSEGHVEAAQQQPYS